MKNSQQFSPEQLLEIEENQHMNERLETAQYLAHLSDEMNNLDVPEWDRTVVHRQVDNVKSNERGFQLLPWFSLACSIFAICLVTLNVHVTQSDQGLTIAFNSGGNESISEAEIAVLVDEKVKLYQQESELAMAQLAMQLQKDQNQSNIKLATYLLDSARQERKQDISDVIMHFSDQLADHDSRQKIQFNQLEREVKFQRAGYNDSNL